jgi:hypothetical protein
MSLIDKIKDKAHEFGEKVSDKAKDMGLTKIGSSFKDKLKEGYGDIVEKGEDLKDKVGEKIGKFGPFKALEKDAKLGRTLHSDVIAALNILQENHKDVKKLLEKAYGFAVLPSCGRASLVLGGAYGVGEVFEKEKVVGYSGIIKLDLGVQIGGTNFHEVIVFNDKEVWKQFKAGKYAFSADAAVAIVKAGAQASRSFGAGTVVFVYNEGGELLDLSIGIQKFIFRQTALGKVRTTEGADAEYKGSDKKKASEQRPAEKRDKTEKEQEKEEDE